ncbi:serine hydrolase domain-containing protein [Thermodesulfobacteriota bacterium]
MRQLRGLAIILLVLVSISPVSCVEEACTPVPDPGPDGKIAHIADFVQSRAPQTGIAIVFDGNLVATTGTGGADGETIFWIASTTKFVTGVGAVALEGEGLLDTEAVVTSYVTDYTEQNDRQDRILVRDLLQNVSGLPQDGGCVGFACRQDLLTGDPTTTQYDLMVPDRGAVLGNVFTPAMLAKIPYNVFNLTAFEPGTDWKYSGWGWMLAGRAMEIAAGEDFPTLMQTRVLDNARMCRATYDGALVDQANQAFGTGTNPIDGWCIEPMLAPGHQGEGEPYYHDELDCAVRMPQGGLHASALDMGLLAEAVLSDLAGAGIITSAASMRRLFCPDGGGTGMPGDDGEDCFGRVATGGSEAQYGYDYGFGNFRRSYVYQGKTYDVFNHGGGRAGFSSLFALVPEAGFAVAIVANTGGAAGWQDATDYAIRCYLHDDC